VIRQFAASSRRWGVLALALVPILVSTGCGSSSQFPVASSAVASTCSALDKFFLSRTAPQSELDKVLKQAKNSGDSVMENSARAYQAAAAASNPSGKNESFAKMIGRCQYYGMGPNETP
jgi:hypothetical protein